MMCNYESFIVRAGLCIRKVNRIISATMLPLMSKVYKSEALKRVYHKLTTMDGIYFFSHFKSYLNGYHEVCWPVVCGCVVVLGDRNVKHTLKMQSHVARAFGVQV